MQTDAHISPRAIATVDLGAIAANVRALRARLTGGARLCAVVKADAYGHGAVPVARAALGAGAGMLAVATAAEAERLREDGIGAGILVLGPLSSDDFERAHSSGAEVVLWSERFARRIASSGTDVHLKLDSGMGRLGIRDPLAAARLAEFVNAAPGLRLAGAMTHFATADEPGSAFAAEQLARFRAWAEPLRTTVPDLTLHAANSAATLALPEAHLDMVRVGIAAYGMDPFQQDARRWGLEPALRLDSYVADVKDCRRGDSVGYGRAFVASRHTRIATVPIGYADGVRRALGGRGRVAIGGERHPIVGNISMDTLAVDVGAAKVTLGDGVELIGPLITAEEMAANLGTINYEITCGLTQRVSRVYRSET